MILLNIEKNYKVGERVKQMDEKIAEFINLSAKIDLPVNEVIEILRDVKTIEDLQVIIDEIKIKYIKD